ncbi:MAG: mechanosensitive ion channel family protein [Candidatus Aenigmarchaeota archaeon]|nr:mechanosensitive ion channel family protein [Candidatus Aenigmarchaeota archaeon]
MEILTAIKSVPYLMEAIESIIIIFAAYLINKFIFQKWILRTARKANIKKKILKPLENLISFTIYLIAIFFVLGVLGLKGSVTGLLASAGFAGIVVGFATKDIIENFLSGIILIIDPKISIGDIVEVNGISGKIEDINIRTTSIMTWDGELVVVPNSRMANEIIKNRSLYKPLIRLRLPVGVEYECDMKKAIKVCNDVMGKIKEIEKDPKPQVVFEEFGDSSLNFELRFWVDMNKVSPPEVKTKVSIELNKALKKAKIGIPYPHIEVIHHNK